MKKLIGLVCLLPAVAWAEAGTSSVAAGVPSTPAEAFDIVGMLLKAFTEKNWALGSGLLLALVVWGLRHFRVLDKVKLGSSWGIKISVLVMAIGTSVAVGLQTGLGAMEIVESGLVVAFVSVGGWEFVGKAFSILSKKSVSDGDS